MQNVSQESAIDKCRAERVNVQYDIQASSTPHSNSSPTKSETETYSERRRYMSDTSESDEDSVSEVESFMIDQDFELDPATKLLLNPDEDRSTVDPETQARLEALLQAADEAAAALTRMRTDNPRATLQEKTSLVDACTDGDVRTVQKLLTEGGRSVHETSEEGESLLSLACSAGYFELAQVLLAMHANVEDRGIKGECTPLMEAASAGHLDIVRLLVAHDADVNAQSTTGNTPLMYGCAGGHTEVVEFLIENGANVEDNNENGHTPLMEAASAGHVGLAKLLLDKGAGINTHSNEFKESALTLACYKGHLNMVRYLLEAGADQEHKTDEMHTALMEASMDGHVEVARLLLDSGAQVNMPTDSFESPLTLAACGGHVDLAMLLIERGANIEEVNDEGYTPLMEAAREGHEEMVHLLLGQGANINAQTDETQETALTLACCGGFTDVADILLKAGANIELGASTPLMEASQEGHLDLVRYLLQNGANVEAQTQTGDTALTYACENGHTDVADCLLQYGANLEHESEGGRTPLMKACRAGHLCTVQFLISKGANVKKQTTNNDHTPLSLACAGGHMSVVELLLGQNADPNHKLKDNSTMLIEAAKGGHTNVVQLLLDFPHSIQSLALNQQHQVNTTPSTSLPVLPAQMCTRSDGSLQQNVLNQNGSQQPVNYFPQPSVLQEVPEAVQIIPQDDLNNPNNSDFSSANNGEKKSASPKGESSTTVYESNLTSAEAQQVRSQPRSFNFDEDILPPNAAIDLFNKEDQNSTIIDFIKNRKKHYNNDDGTTQKQQILEELHKVERELQSKQPHSSVFQYTVPQDQVAATTTRTTLPNMMNIDIAMQPGPNNCLQSPTFKLGNSESGTLGNTNSSHQPAFYFTPLSSSVTVSLNTATTSTANQPVKFLNVPLQNEVRENTAVSDRPKAKPAKKDGKNLRKQQQQQQQQQQPQAFPPVIYSQQQLQTQQQQTQFVSANPGVQQTGSLPQTEQKPSQLIVQNTLNVPGIDLDSLDEDSLIVKDDTTDSLTSSILQQFQNTTLRDFVDSNVQPYPSALDESMIATLAVQQDIQSPTQAEFARAEYFALPGGATTQVPIHGLYPYEHYLTTAGMPEKDHIYQAGFQAGINLMQQVRACPSVAVPEHLTVTSTANVGPQQPAVGGATIAPVPPPNAQQQFIAAAKPVPLQIQSTCTHLGQAPMQTAPPPHLCQMQCAGGQPQLIQGQLQQTGQVQAATQTLQTQNLNTADSKKQPKIIPTTSSTDNVKVKKGRVLRHQNQAAGNFQPNQSYHIDANSGITQYNSANNQPCANPIVVPSGMDVDSETESNHDTALTLACAGGHEELVELLLNRGADIEHRDKKGFTPLILAATAGHQKVVEILLNHNADIEAQSERTKDTPLSLACSGGRYEVVEMLLKRNANKEHRNVSDYTPLSLAASGGYVNIIKLLLNSGAEINSRTGSKLGISPLMLAAMNGHTAAVKLLLDMGSDINAQIETNRNTALTLACFQGRHEVVSLLLDRKANVEHRAKTGLTPLMEAASGGYVEVGRVLLDKGADVNATPVPSSRDTALTIAADKGHVRFVELLLCRGALVEVKNKKGNSPLWLAANGGHLSVVELLYNVNADIDSQDNRKVSCLMAAFRKGHIKVVKWMVHSVNQFPSDQEMVRYLSTINDKELLEKCQECVKIIRAAKETQAVKANKNASILLEELDKERTREESKKLAAARRRERKKKKKLEKKEEKRKLLEENKKNEHYDDKSEKDNSEEKDDVEDTQVEATIRHPAGEVGDKEEGDSGIDANSQGSCSSNDINSKDQRKEKKKKKSTANVKGGTAIRPAESSSLQTIQDQSSDNADKSPADKLASGGGSARKNLAFEGKSPAERDDFEATGNETYMPTVKSPLSTSKKGHSAAGHDEKSVGNSPKQNTKREEGWKEVVRKSSVQTVSTSGESGSKKVSVPLNAISRVIGRGGSNINAIRAATGAHIEVEKQCKGQGERIITIKGTPEAAKQAYSLITVLIKDSDVDIMQMLPKAVKTNTSATTLWDKTQLGTKKVAGKAATAVAAATAAATAQKTDKISPANSVGASSNTMTKHSAVSGASVLKTKSSTTMINNRQSAAPPRLLAQAEKNNAIQNTTTSSSSARTIVQHPSSHPVTASTRIAPKTATGQSFAAKLNTDSCVPSTSNTLSLGAVGQSVGTVSQAKMKTLNTSQHTSNDESVTTRMTRMMAVGGGNSSPVKHPRPEPTASAPPTMQHFQSPRKSAAPVGSSSNNHVTMSSNDISTIGCNNDARSTTPIKKNTMQMSHMTDDNSHLLITSSTATAPGHLEYSLFNSELNQPMWRRTESETQKPLNFASIAGSSTVIVQNTKKFIEQNSPPLVDASKAPGYRGGSTCSPVSSKTSSNSVSPPNMVSSAPYAHFHEQPQKSTSQQQQQSQQHISHIGNTILRATQAPQKTELSGNANYYNDIFKQGPTVAAGMSNNVLSIAKENHLISSYNQSQSRNSSIYSQASQPIVSMSRLNPKAPDFSSSIYSGNAKLQQSQQQQPPPPPQQSQLYNGGYLMDNSNIYCLAKEGGYRNAMSQPNHQLPLMQLQQPLTQQQTEMISGMATGLTLHNLARATGGEIIDSTPELNIINNSPNMSPSMVVSMQHASENNQYIDDRKTTLPQPQPIGTERARKYFSPNLEANNWMLPNDKSSQRWPNPNLDRLSLRGVMDPSPVTSFKEPQVMDTFKHGIQLENSHNFSNGPAMPSFLPMGGNVRNQQQEEFVVAWNATNSRQDIIEDKHVWTMSDWKQ